MTAPTLVLHGIAGALLDPANGRSLAGLIPGARLELIDGVGHLSWWEQPGRTIELLRGHTKAG